MVLGTGWLRGASNLWLETELTSHRYMYDMDDNRPKPTLFRIPNLPQIPPGLRLYIDPNVGLVAHDIIDDTWAQIRVPLHENPPIIVRIFLE